MIHCAVMTGKFQGIELSSHNMSTLSAVRKSVQVAFVFVVITYKVINLAKLIFTDSMCRSHSERPVRSEVGRPDSWEHRHSIRMIVHKLALPLQAGSHNPYIIWQ